jgi:hypothetical protein
MAKRSLFLVGVQGPPFPLQEQRPGALSVSRVARPVGSFKNAHMTVSSLCPLL